MTRQIDQEDGAARRIRAALLMARRVEGDRLALADATLVAALDGSRPLTAGERAALQASPLTLRRFRQLAMDRLAAARPHADDWRGSGGMLRAASSGAPSAIVTDDGWWTLHLVADGTVPTAWRAILQLAPQAPFAGDLLARRAPLRVVDGAGATLLAGRLDADGEIEAAWPFAAAPADYLHASGARIVVQPAPPSS
jgi:hypothetical protein